MRHMSSEFIMAVKVGSMHPPCLRTLFTGEGRERELELQETRGREWDQVLMDYHMAG